MGAIFSGYRPNHVFEYKSNGEIKGTYIGDIVFNHIDRIEPGSTEFATVRFLNIPGLERFIHAGQKWLLHEGRRLVGDAEIMEVIQPFD